MATATTTAPEPTVAVLPGFTLAVRELFARAER
jgi:hypothetical protein